jgi:hypothetical protein
MKQIAIAFAQGAGGHWLFHLIDCLINNKLFVEQKKNWHPQYRTVSKIPLLLNHTEADPDFILSSRYPYNLWCNYFIKNIKREQGGLKSVIVDNGQRVRLIKDPYTPANTTDINESDFNWLFYQARFILQFNKTYPVNLYYEDLITNPDLFYSQIVSVLTHKQIEFVDNRQLFDQARLSFLKSIDNIRTKGPNPRHWSYQLWEMAYIDSQFHIGPPSGWYNALGTDELREFVLQYRLRALSETEKLFTVL